MGQQGPGQGPRKVLDRCRLLGHAWYETPDDAGWSSRRVWQHRMVLRCDRCGTVRYDGIDARGDIGSRHYVYPDSYRYPKDETPTRAELRLAMLAPPAERRRRRLGAVDQLDAPAGQHLAHNGPHDDAAPAEAPAGSGAA